MLIIKKAFTGVGFLKFEKGSAHIVPLLLNLERRQFSLDFLT